MANVLSDQAKAFLGETRVGVLSTINKDGSSQLTTMWYLMEEDGTIIFNTISSNKKVKNLRRDPRIALCVGDTGRSVSLYGTVTISDDETVVRKDIEQLVRRYVPDEAARAHVIDMFVQQPRVSLHFKPEKVTEFSV